MNTQDMTRDELLALVAAQQTKLLAAQAPKRLTMRVGEKKGVCVYGMGRNPTTLYAAQWIRLLEAKEDILAFVEANRDALSWTKEKA